MRLIKTIKKIYSYFPFLTITDDNNFGTNEGIDCYGEGETPSYRFSIINFCFGTKAYYFITFNLKEKKFNVCYCLQLERCGKLAYYCSSESITKKADKYQNEHLVELSDEDINYEKEFILYLIHNENQRIEHSTHKINLYTTIILAIISIIIVFFDIEVFLQFRWYEKLLAIFIAYCILNIAKYLLDSVKVRSIDKSSFAKLKSSTNKQYQILWNYYFDWQMLREKATIWVSFIKNIEEWIKFALVLVIILTIITSINYTMNKNIDITKENNFVSIDLNHLENPFSNDSKKLLELHLVLKNREISTLYIVGNPSPEDEIIKRLLLEFYIYEPDISVEYFQDISQKHEIIKFYGGS